MNIFYPSICLLVNAWDEREAGGRLGSAVDRLSGGGLVGPLAAVRRPRRQDDEHLLQELGAALFTEGRERTTWRKDSKRGKEREMGENVDTC